MFLVAGANQVDSCFLVITIQLGRTAGPNSGSNRRGIRRTAPGRATSLLVETTPGLVRALATRHF